MNITNLFFSGVGGQGIIFISKVLTTGLVKSGYDVKMSEVHGMAQRGGSVTTQIRFGEKIFSPVISKGQADIIIALEKLEGLRYLEYLKPGGKVLVNDYSLYPSPVLSGQASYPDDILEEIKGYGTTICINGPDIVSELGNARVMNTVMLGALIKVLALDKDISWMDVLSELAPKTLLDCNLEALNAGMNSVTDLA